IKDWLEKELHNVFAKNAAERLGGWVIKFKGMKISFNAFGEKGDRLQDVSVGGKPLDLEKNYNISACEREGDPEDMLCRLKNVANARNTPHTLHSVLKEYLAANSPVTPAPPLNAKILDAPQTLLTQVTGVDYQFT
ncbi:MAG: bifunctional metallophosphatase/5'-nucleotidase, partial [Chitinophagaceae bacterium]